MYTTEDVVQAEMDQYMDAFYGYLLNESNYELLPDVIRDMFHNLTHNYKFDLAFALDGEEEEYFADYTYFLGAQYANKAYVSIPIGEIEIEKAHYDSLTEESKQDWTVNGDYAYHVVPAITIVYDLEHLKEIVVEAETEVV